MKKLTREWVRKAEVDYRGARQLARSRSPLHDLVCFCCQQAAEKYLKALLEEGGLVVRRTHDLEDLLASLLPVHPDLTTLGRGAKFLIQFAVDTRYPGFQASKRQAESALRCAGRVRSTCRLLLGIEPRGRRRKKPP
jgi:HEPN domain-containing protein